jgi:transcriptional regulator with PAS, ATPase and Fis domain
MDDKTGKFVDIVRDLLNHQKPDANPIHPEKRCGQSDEPKNALTAIIGESQDIKDLRRKIALIARYPIKPVLITGETGTGKELVAEALHQSSPLSHKPFLRINCSAIPDTLLESQLFGHKRGSFTGAVKDQKGIFEAADGGTVLLDEIGELKLSLQPKLLRFLENGTFYRVGETTETRVNVWVIASTNTDLEGLVSEGLFRKDLFYRLNPFKLNTPPLRERIEDISLLVDEFTRKMGFDPENIDQRFVHKLVRCKWDGNVRELRHVVESYLIHGKAGNEDFMMSEAEMKSKQQPFKSGQTLKDAVRENILQVFYRNGKKIRKTARDLGIDRATLRKKLNTYGIPVEDEVG